MLGTYPDNPLPGAVTTQEFRAFAALLGGGAWDAAPTAFAVPHSCRLTLFVEYAQAGVGGSVDVDVQTSPHGVDQVAPALTWFSLSLLGANAAVAGAESRGQLEPFYINFDPTTAAREAITIDLSFPAYVERVRVRCREVGAQATPGSCRVWGMLSPVDGASQGLMRLVQDEINATVVDAPSLGLPSGAAYVHAPAVATAAVVTLAATPGIQHCIDGLVFSYAGGVPVGGNVIITDAGVTVFNIDVPAAGTYTVSFPNGLQSALPNTALVVTLAAAGAAVTGKMTVLGYRPSTVASGLVGAAAYVNAPAANTAAVVTLAGVAGVRHCIDGVVISYDAVPVGGNLTISDAGVVVLNVDLPAQGPQSVLFPSSLRSAAANTAMVATLTAGGLFVTGKMNVVGYRAT